MFSHKIKIKLKLLLLLLIGIAIYLLFPLKTTSLLYISKDNSTKLVTDATPLNLFDTTLLTLFDIKGGWIRVPKETNRYKLYQAILFKPREKTRTMIMYGGATIKDFLDKIAKQAHLDSQIMLSIYHKYALFHEASILSKHYKIPYNTNEPSTIAYMLNDSYKHLDSFAKKYATPLKSKAFKKKLIIASIIEKETQNYKEMPLIASVIYNRLKKNMRLQMDATLNYKAKSHKIVTPEMIKNDHSAYNSYKHKGLPPQPLASVSIASLNAAFNPAKSNYLYFVKSKDGKRHLFSALYKKHLKKVKKYKVALRKKLSIKRRAKSLILANIPPSPKLLPFSAEPITVRATLKQ